MRTVANFLANKKALFFILAIGIVLRLLFIIFLGEIYYGNQDFFIQNDTKLWIKGFINLWETGTYTTNPLSEAGKFFRLPGYSFLFGLFYLLAFKNILIALHLLITAQFIMDVTSIYLVYRIAWSVVKNAPEESKQIFSHSAALLYAIYPFAILWTPVLYAETPSIFFLLLGIYFAFKQITYRTVFLCSIFTGCAILFRLQCIFCLPLIAFVFIVTNPGSPAQRIKIRACFGLGILLSYGLWPARNLLLQNRILFSQDLTNVGNVWSIDFLSFMDFSHAVSTDIVPTYKQIIENGKVEWPDEAYLDPGDSHLLDSVVTLCRRCGSGFSHWAVSENLREKRINPSENCDTTIRAIFTSLTEKQKSRNAFNYWIAVPAGNLYKCLFKFSLYKPSSTFVKWASSFLFFIRSLLIFLGLWGMYSAWKNQFLSKRFLFLVSGFMLVWYFYLSFFWRNIEMRFLLQCDVLLLIPVAYLMTRLFSAKRVST